MYVPSVRAAFFLSVHANVTNGNGTHSTCRTSGGCCCGDRDAFLAYVFSLVLWASRTRIAQMLSHGAVESTEPSMILCFKRGRGSEWGKHWITERNKNGALVMAFFLFDSPPLQPKLTANKAAGAFHFLNGRDGFVSTAVTTAHIPPIAKIESIAVHASSRHASESPSNSFGADCHFGILTGVVYGKPVGKRTSDLHWKVSIVSAFPVRW